MHIVFKTPEEKIMFALTALVGNIVQELSKVEDIQIYIEKRTSLQEKIVEMRTFLENLNREVLESKKKRKIADEK